jgi:hypothetical protein
MTAFNRLLMTVASLLVIGAAIGLRAEQQFMLFASFVDSSTGQPVVAIGQDQVEIREDDVACRILRMEPIDWPVRVELLIDNGAGVGSANLMHLRSGVRAFMQELPSGVVATAITTAPQPRTLVAPTANRQTLLRGAELLTPDDSAGRFIDALSEAAARIEKARARKDGGNDFPVVVALGSTAVEGSLFVERDIERLVQRFQRQAATVHVVMLSSVGSSVGGGAVQVQMGLAITRITGGRYENIAAPSRIETLLPDIARQIARSHARQSQQFRIIFERPGAKSGPLGKVTVAGPPSLTVQLSTDGRLPQ